MQVWGEGITFWTTELVDPQALSTLHPFEQVVYYYAYSCTFFF